MALEADALEDNFIKSYRCDCLSEQAAVSTEDYFMSLHWNVVITNESDVSTIFGGMDIFY